MRDLRILTALAALALGSSLRAQGNPAPVRSQLPNNEVTAQLKDIARFRGIRSNTLTGLGLVLGLEGSGDSQRVAPTRSALANFLRRSGQQVDERTLDTKNVALVMVTTELPPFAVNGQRLDVTVTSIGDAKSLRNGTLIMTELKAAGDAETVYATASGAVSVGGFSVSQNGNSQQKGFVTVGRVPSGGIVERGAATNTVFNGRMFIELDEPDLTTASHVEQTILRTFPEFRPVAQNGGTIEITLPEGMTPTAAMARIEKITVQSDSAALVVINEKTGAIVMGGNVKLAPVAFAYGSLTIRVEEQTLVSQPAPFSNGTTQRVPQTTTGAQEDPAKTAVTTPNTTVADLAQIFRRLNLSAGDIIAILQALRQQGALKARIVMQ